MSLTRIACPEAVVDYFYSISPGCLAITSAKLYDLRWYMIAYEIDLFKQERATSGLIPINADGIRLSLPWFNGFEGRFGVLQVRNSYTFRHKDALNQARYCVLFVSLF